MRIGRTLPPTAAPMSAVDLRHALAGVVSPAREIRAREDELRRFFNVKHVALVSSGTAALALALRALASGSSRRQVVIPAYTCFSVPGALVHAGLEPVLCDVDCETLDYDHRSLEPLLTRDTLAVVTQHLFGLPSDVGRLLDLCRPRGIAVIEDAAQAMGVRTDEGLLGTLGDVGIFSLGRGKNITCGSGGIVVTDDDSIGRSIEDVYRQVPDASLARSVSAAIQLAVMSVFIRPQLYWIPASLPFLGLGQTVYPKHVRVERLSGLQAGLLRHWESRLDRANRDRAETAAALSQSAPGTLARRVPHPYLRLPLLARSAAERAEMHATSEREGLGLSVAYPSPVNEIPEIRQMFKGQQFPAAARIAERLLTAPTHHWLSANDRNAIARVIAR